MPQLTENEFLSVTYNVRLDMSLSIRVVELKSPSDNESRCEAIIDHMLDCDTCMGSTEAVCGEYIQLRKQLDDAGGAKSAEILAF